MVTTTQTLHVQVDALGYAHPMTGELLGDQEMALALNRGRPVTLPDPAKVEEFARELGLTGHIYVRPFVHGGPTMPRKPFNGRTHAHGRNLFVIFVDAGLPEDGSYDSFSRVLRHEFGHVKDLQERADRLGSLQAAVDEDQDLYETVNARMPRVLAQGEEAYKRWLFEEYDQLPSERAANEVANGYDVLLS